MKRVSFCYDYDLNDVKHVSIECSDFHYVYDRDLIVLICDHIRYYIPFHSLYNFIVEDI